MKNQNPVDVFKYCPKCGQQKLTVKHDRAIHCVACGFEYFFNSSGAVIALIYNTKGELLITRRAQEPWKGGLDLPGGFIEPNETAEEATIREIKEELNLDVISMEYLFSNHNQYPYSGLIVHTVDFVFRVTVTDFSNLKVDDDVSECFFLPREELKPGMFAIKSCNDVFEKLNTISEI